jgi:glycosyltransferase involved in cell wall biosynthesis
MKVLYDHQIFAMQPYGGISRIFATMLEEYRARQDIDLDIGFTNTPNEYLLNNEALQTKLGYQPPLPPGLLSNVNFRGKGRLNKLLGRSALDPYATGQNITVDKLNQGNFDVFHPTYYHPYYLQHIGNKPNVIFVYDMIHELFLESMAPTELIRLEHKAQCVAGATRIIAISQSTKDDLVNVLQVDPDKVDVVHLANMLGTEPRQAAIKLPEKYLYFVGNRSSYKNFYLFVQVFAQAVKTIPDLHLVCAGGGAFNDFEQKLLRQLGVTNKVIYIGGKDEIIRAGYAKALAAVVPALYEGFGLPILEAWDFDCPVISSNNKCFQEVAGDAVEYFNPKDWQATHTAIINIVSNTARREQLIAAGRIQRQKYSVAKMATEIKAVYEKAVAQVSQT